jgi:branched-chain amino acid aminotransferase
MGKERDMAVRISRVEAHRMKPRPVDESKLGFGRIFTDHMFMMEHGEKGWHDARVEPHHKLELDPAAMVLHYGQAVFEGLKAYRGKDGGVYLFRYMDNLARLARSCERLEIPAFPLDVVAEGLKQVVLIDREWIPRSKGSSLYIRPTVVATDPFVGVRPSVTYYLYIILSPVGAYYPEGFSPVRIWVSEEYVRAVRGGVGEAKCAGNYAASLKAQVQAQKAGCTQVLWLDALERRYVEEVGTMNMFWVIRGEVVTSPLTGSILPGITRESVIRLLRDWGIKVSERMLSIDEVVEGAASGDLEEAFGSGTAAIISPVGWISYRGQEHEVGEGKVGPVSLRLYNALLDMQYGNAPAPDGWVERIDV